MSKAGKNEEAENKKEKRRGELVSTAVFLIIDMATLTKAFFAGFIQGYFGFMTNVSSHICRHGCWCENSDFMEAFRFSSQSVVLFCVWFSFSLSVLLLITSSSSAGNDINTAWFCSMNRLSLRKRHPRIHVEAKLRLVD